MNASLPIELMHFEPLPPITEAELKELSYPHRKPLFLVGMMGAGKTTLGRHLARHLDREFMDLDHELEHRCGVSIADIFDIEGEAGFRKRETAALDYCTRQSSIVLATGGGAVLAPENRAYLKQRGLVVYLRASADELYKRVARDKNRPLLQTANPQQRLIELLAQREALYAEVADIVFDTTAIGAVPTVVKQLLELLKQHEVS